MEAETKGKTIEELSEIITVFLNDYHDLKIIDRRITISDVMYNYTSFTGSATRTVERNFRLLQFMVYRIIQADRKERAYSDVLVTIVATLNHSLAAANKIRIMDPGDDVRPAEELDLKEDVVRIRQLVDD